MLCFIGSPITPSLSGGFAAEFDMVLNTESICLKYTPLSGFTKYGLGMKRILLDKNRHADQGGGIYFIVLCRSGITECSQLSSRDPSAALRMTRHIVMPTGVEAIPRDNRRSLGKNNVKPIQLRCYSRLAWESSCSKFYYSH